MSPDIPISTPTAGAPCTSHGCAHCCYDTEMLLSDADIARFERAGHKLADFGVHDENGYVTLRNVYPGDDAFTGTKGRAADWEAPAAPEDEPVEGEESPKFGGHCVFLKDGQCSVYVDRPAGCRFYPWTLDVTGTRAVRDDECPHTDEFPTESAVQRRMKQHLNSIVREAQIRVKGTRKAKVEAPAGSRRAKRAQ